jgi:DNA-binding response OmpR family regulator
MHKPRLLVIEDEEQIASMISRIATEEGFTATTASGLKMIERTYLDFQPDVIILDIVMPDMDGLEVLQFLHRQFSKAHIIILSGSEALSRRIAETLGKALGLMMVANMSKPFRVDPMRKLLQETRESLASLPNSIPVHIPKTGSIV